MGPGQVSYSRLLVQSGSLPVWYSKTDSAPAFDPEPRLPPLDSLDEEGMAEKL